jgi:hypothetical protein
MTPEEAFSEKKPSVEHLRIFGCQSRRKNGRKLMMEDYQSIMKK